jgi:hypothetical protein
MTDFKIADLERLVALEQANGSSTSQYPTDSSTFQAPAHKSDVRRDIYTAVMMSGCLVSRGEIAKLLGLKKSPWFVAAIEELVNAGYLLKYVQERPNQLPIYFYSVPA